MNFAKLFKYLLIGIIIYFTLVTLPKQKLENQEIIIVSAIASISFALIDMYSPSIRIEKNAK